MKRLVVLIAIAVFLVPLFAQEPSSTEVKKEIRSPENSTIKPEDEKEAEVPREALEQSESTSPAASESESPRPAASESEALEQSPAVQKPKVEKVERVEQREPSEHDAVYERVASQDYSRRRPRYSKREVIPIFGSKRGNGGYGAVSMGYTEIAGRDALTIGARGAWIIGHGLGLGMGGYGFVNDPEYNALEGRYYNLSGGYGGLIIEPILLGRWPVHMAFPVLLGAGGVALTSYDEYFFSSLEPYDAFFEDAVPFLVVEPGVELDFNLLRWLRLSISANYRMTTEMVSSRQINVSDIEGWSYGMTLKIGSF